MASSAVICIVNVEGSDGGAVTSLPQALALTPPLTLSAAAGHQVAAGRGAAGHQAAQHAADDLVVFEDDAGGTALGVATVDVACDAGESTLTPGGAHPDAHAAPPQRRVTQYIRLPVRGAVRVAGGDLDEHWCKREQ